MRILTVICSGVGSRDTCVSKNVMTIFFALKTPILVMIFRKNVKKVGGSFPI